MNFDKAFKLLIGHEGGYAHDPKDPGGETKFGISKRAYPEVDVANLTLNEAKEIYKIDYWDILLAEELPEEIRFSVFDAAVNSGNRQAIKWLQQAVGVIDDGIIGPKTLAAINEADPYKLVGVFSGIRLRFMVGLPTFDRFGKGWTRRVAENLINM